MKTFLPVISPTLHPWQTMRLSLEALDNKRLGKQRVEAYQIWRTITGQLKAWRAHPATHAWYGYPDALGVYVAINCALWARRKSATTGKFFSNEKMAEHVARCKFGCNSAGQQVFQLEPLVEEEEQKEEDEQVDEEQKNDNSESEEVVEAAAAVAVPAVAIAAAAAASSAAPSPSSSTSPSRQGTYVDGIRIPWWLHDRRVHDSDAAVLYRKDKKYYRAFKGLSKQYEEYVWPRDINPLHPEQKEELDALAADIEKDQLAKEAKKAKNNKKKATNGGKKRKRTKGESESEGEEAADDNVASDAASAEPADVVPASAATPTKKTRVTRSSIASSTGMPSPLEVTDLSPAHSRSASSSSSSQAAVEPDWAAAVGGMIDATASDQLTPPPEAPTSSSSSPRPRQRRARGKRARVQAAESQQDATAADDVIVSPTPAVTTSKRAKKDIQPSTPFSESSSTGTASILIESPTRRSLQL